MKMYRFLLGFDVLAFLVLLFFFATQLWQIGAGTMLPATLAWRRDLLYLGRYVFIIMALQIRPDAPRPGRSEEELRRLDTTGAVLFVLSLIGYVLVSPSMHDPAAGSLTTLRILYLTLDLFLVVRTVSLSRHSPIAHWRHAYAWLAVACVSAMSNATCSPGAVLMRVAWCARRAIIPHANRPAASIAASSCRRLLQSRTGMIAVATTQETNTAASPQSRMCSMPT